MSLVTLSTRSARGRFGNRRRRTLKMNRRPKLESLESRVVPSVVDLTTIGSSGTINGAIYRQAMTSPGGSGSLHSFVQIRRDGTEYGYNTDARPYTDPVLRDGGTQTTASFNRALRLSTVPLVAVGGQVYLQFSLEINQKKSAPLLSLDEVQVSLASSGRLQGYTSDGTYRGHASLIYDMDGSSSTWVKLNGNLAPGTGRADMFLDIPFSDLPDSAFSGANRSLPLRSTEYVYLYSHFGDQKLNTKHAIGSANDGYEEWAGPALGAHASTTRTTIYNATTNQPIVNPEAAGISVKDSATVTDSSHRPTGTVTFLFYHNASGTGTPIGAGTVKLNASGVASYSDVEGPLAPGSYSFVAHYNGNCCHMPSTSAPEPLMIAAARPIFTTTQSPTSVTLSSATPPVLTDSAKLSSGYFPTGTITFQLYAPNGTTVVDTEMVTVSGNGTYSTPTGYTPPTSGTVTGTYQWVASYSGDGNNKPVSTNTGDEPVTVAPASPTISTTSNPTDVTLDGSGSPTLKDSATLDGAYNAVGSISFRLYAPDGTTVVDTETVTVSGNGTYSTPTGYALPTSGTVTGTYQWVASYSGDGNNKPVNSNAGDEPVTVTPASPTVSTTPNPTDVTLDGSGSPTLKDSATLDGAYNAVGSISFRLYAPDGTTVVDTEMVTVSGNGTYSTPTGYTVPTSGTVTGTYEWVASYSGDGNNKPVSSNKGNEPVTVNQAMPAISTTTSPTQVTVGTSPFNDSATLSEGYSPTGTITFTLYAPDGTTVVYTDHVTVNGNGVYATTSGDNPGGYVPIVAGTYEWTASYSGDGNNNAVSGPKGDEPVIATTQITFLTTSAIPSSVTLDSTESATLKDSGTLTGGFNPTASLTFTLYAPDGTTVVDTETVTVSGNGTYSTPTGYTLPTTGLVAGTYQWVVSYSGDPNNDPASTTKGDEPVAVAPASPTISTTPNTTDITLDGSGSPTLKDSATLAGAYNATGTITFSLYAPDGSTVVDTEMVTVSGNGTYSTPTGYTLPTSGTVTGTYQWVASYSGDGNNNAGSSIKGDEPVTVALASPTISTTPNPTDVALDGGGPPTLKDSATLARAYNAIGSISFRLYAPDGTTVLDTETVTVYGNGTYSTPTGYTLPTSGTVTGTYQWVASYSGDGNNKPVSSDTGDEPVTVAPASPMIVTVANPTAGLVGAMRLQDSATLSGGYQPAGEIIFTLYASDHITAVYSEQVDANGNTTVGTTNGWVPTAAGTYYWTASYSGDANNIGGTSGASDEPVTVSNGTSSITTVIVDTSGVPVTSAHALGASRSTALSQDKRDRAVINKNAGATVLDTATVGTLSGITPTGTVTYSFTGTNGTSLAGLTAPAGWTVSADKLTWTETVTMSGGKVPDSAPTTALPPGSYMFVGQYSGDANFPGATSALEPLLVKDPTSGAIIEPPQTACRQVTSDLAHGLAGQSNVTVRTHVSDGKIGPQVTPPYFTYYVRLFARARVFRSTSTRPRPILCSHSPRCPATSPCTTPIPR